MDCIRWLKMFIRCIVFFFFKQKTAYEMRISDWSSDVCSSDLGELVQIERGLYALRNTTHEVIPARQIEIGGRFAQIATAIATYIAANPSKICRVHAPRFNHWPNANFPHIYRSEEHTPEPQSLMRNPSSVLRFITNSASTITSFQ